MYEKAPRSFPRRLLLNENLKQSEITHQKDFFTLMNAIFMPHSYFRGRLDCKQLLNKMTFSRGE
jgi:hypothetical protein